MVLQFRFGKGRFSSESPVTCTLNDAQGFIPEGNLTSRLQFVVLNIVRTSFPVGK
jgi:hypothetical protein